MSDLPHVNAGYIQVEETQFQQSVDTGLYTKMGEDLNYLKDQADTALTDALALFGATNQAVVASVAATTDSGGNYNGTILDLSGKRIRFAIVSMRMPSAQYANYSPNVGLAGIANKRSLFNQLGANWNQFNTGVPGTVPPFLQITVQNAPIFDQIYASIYAGALPIGLGTFPAIPPLTSFAFNITAIYATS